MTGICAEHHPLHSPHLLSGEKSFPYIDIPPRRLLTRRSNLPISSNPSEKPTTEETSLHKFLPYNGGDDDDESDPYSSDDFRMYEFKIRRCMRSRSHDWTECPFAHPGEKARRRDPRRFHYSGNVCSDFRRGGCLRGDACEFSHGVFECWLHPARYRTQACKDGKNCKRKVCFFAHTSRQLRVLPLHSQSTHPLSISSVGNRNYSNSVSASASASNSNHNHCCVFCHSVASSPTSTLMGLSHLSPPLSPTLSPVESRRGYSLISADSSGLKQIFPGSLSYKNALIEIMSSMEGMNLGGDSHNRNVSWVDVSPNREEQQQFILSPSTEKASGSRDFFKENGLGNRLMDEKSNNNLDWSCADLDWVNELVM